MEGRGYEHRHLYPRHHLFWNREWYTGSFEKEWRNDPNWVVPIYVAAHGLLHYGLDRLDRPKPTKRMMGEVREYVGPFEYLNRLSGAMKALEYFDGLAYTSDSPREATLAQAIGEHILNQLPYFEMSNEEADIQLTELRSARDTRRHRMING